MPLINEEELMHYGVLGMKWGVRKDRRSITSFGAKRKARKDARRLADAEFQGGVGSRKKKQAVKSEIEARKKLDERYAKEFDRVIDKERSEVGTRWIKDMNKTMLVGGAIAYYVSNKAQIDTFVLHNARTLVEGVKIANEKRKRGR